jgi:hypothetical protein
LLPLLLRRSSCPSGLDECPMDRHTIRSGDEALSLGEVCPWCLLLSHALTSFLVAYTVYRKKA